MTPFSSVRQPAVAGAFYPGTAEGMETALKTFMPGEREKPGRVKGVISPHAGWIYSGGVAGAVFGSIEVPDNVILIGPNHRGLGAPASIDDSRSWSFPFGDVPLNREIAESIKEGFPGLEFDPRSHMMEHSLEVIVPFLHARNPEVSIVPVALYTEEEDTAVKLGRAAFRAAEKYGALVVASSDMTHYLPEDNAREIDRETIEVIKGMDPGKVLHRAKTQGALCGGGPVAAMMTACNLLGAEKAELAGYATSGEVSGDHAAVVGYCGMTFS